MRSMEEEIYRRICGVVTTMTKPEACQLIQEKLQDIFKGEIHIPQEKLLGKFMCSFRNVIIIDAFIVTVNR